MRHAMEVALQAFEGALILVSHDRHMLAQHGRQNYYWYTTARWRNTNRTWKATKSGSLSSFRADKPAEQASEAGDSSRKEKRQQAAAQRERIRPLKKQLDKTEAEMTKIENSLAALQERLGGCRYL